MIDENNAPQGEQVQNASSTASGKPRKSPAPKKTKTAPKGTTPREQTVEGNASADQSAAQTDMTDVAPKAKSRKSPAPRATAKTSAAAVPEGESAPENSEAPAKKVRPAKKSSTKSTARQTAKTTGKPVGKAVSAKKAALKTTPAEAPALPQVALSVAELRPDSAPLQQPEPITASAPATEPVFEPEAPHPAVLEPDASSSDSEAGGQLASQISGQAGEKIEALQPERSASKARRARRARARKNRAARLNGDAPEGQNDAQADGQVDGQPTAPDPTSEEYEISGRPSLSDDLDDADDLNFYPLDAAAYELEDHPVAPEDDELDSPEPEDEDDDFVEAVPSPGKGKKSPKGGKTAEVAASASAAKRKMFVSVLPGEQVEVVLTEEGKVQEYYVEMLHQTKIKGNIYKGVIHNVDANLQAAFVSYGAAKNGFLQIDEVHPEYYLNSSNAEKGRKYPPIQKVLKAGQEVLVQVVKEPSGTKGAFLTTYLSMAGRFLVLTPGREQIGVSRKVESEEERARLRELLNGLTPGPGLGVIVRTVSMGVGKTALQRDLQYLKRLWRDIRKKGTQDAAPCLLHQEADLATRAVRDYLTEEVVEVWIDDEAIAAQIAEVSSHLFPRRQNFVQIHKDPGQSLFARFSLQKQLDQVHAREVTLPSGGRLVFDNTEALTAIDINSGRSGGKNNFEDMAYRINMEAAESIPLQLRLRDIGGQIVIDFIEMRDRNHWRDVERAFRNGMRNDRARHDVGRISAFGLLEVVRQRLGSSAISISTELCPLCHGTGLRRNMEWQSLQALKDIMRLIHQAQAQNQSKVTYTGSPELILYLLNQKRERLCDLEKQANLTLDLRLTGI